MFYYFSCFIVYSFFGCGLETLYALFTSGELLSRKVSLLFPLCPVYGLGAIAIILATKRFNGKILPVFISGMAAATTVEFLMDVLYRDLLGVPIWNYSNQPFNINGRVCLAFALAWGFLSVILVKYVHPRVHEMIKNIPLKVNLPVSLITVFDVVITFTLLWLHGDKSIIENVFALYMR